jgi:hypothetical protein
VAALTGRSENAIQLKRSNLGIPNPSGPAWTAEELELLGTAPDAEVAEPPNRTPKPVGQLASRPLRGRPRKGG